VQIGSERCEARSVSLAGVKQLFVGAPFRGCGLGRQLATAIIDAGRAAGYATMKLDTMPSMRSAIELYESLGFP
jgi:putative acetyltransferase